MSNIVMIVLCAVHTGRHNKK